MPRETDASVPRDVELLRRAYAARGREVAVLRARLVDVDVHLDSALHDVRGLTREVAAQEERAQRAEAAAVTERDRADGLSRQLAQPMRTQRFARLLSAARGRRGERSPDL